MSLTINTIGGGGKGLQPQIHVTAPTGSTVTAINGDRVITAQEKIVVTPMTARLPDEYQEVEYIRSTGTQYINTGYKPNTNSKIEIRVSTNDTTNDKPLFGVRTTNTSGGFLCWFNPQDSAAPVYAFGATGNMTTNFGIESGKQYDLTLENGRFVFDSKSTSFTAQPFISNYSLKLFGLDNAGTIDDRKFYGNIYFCKLYESDEVVRDFVPCYIKTTGEAGLYDLVTETFFGNSGTGTFIVGEDVLYEDIVEPFGWDFVLPSLGTWTITGNIDNQVITEDVIVDRVKLYCVELKKLGDLIVTEDVINSGTFTNGTHTILTGQQNDSAGFTLVGRSSNASGSEGNSYADKISWSIIVDLTYVHTLSFYGRKNANHGNVQVAITSSLSNAWNEDEFVLNLRYPDAPTSYTLYTVDVSDYSGEYCIVFVGGYTDSSGYTTSSTSYCDIRFLRA